MERSTDLDQWEQIAFVQGAGNSQHTINYQAVDDRPIQGSSYYRLQQIDEDGSAEITAVQAIHLGLYGTALSIWPNPTEVQRKSILDAERDIAHLLTERDEIRLRALTCDPAKDMLTPRELAANEAHMRARVMQLWQTRLLRFTKLTVADEIENALSYYESTFLREIPKLYAELEHALGQQPVTSPPTYRASSPRSPI